LLSHPHSRYFRDPVPPSFAQYYEQIKVGRQTSRRSLLFVAEPLIIFQSIAERCWRAQEPVAIGDLQARLYRYDSLTQFERDVELIFSNCAHFNAPWSDAARDAQSTCSPISPERVRLGAALIPCSPCCFS